MEGGPAASGSWEELGTDSPPEPPEEVWFCQQLNFNPGKLILELLASRTAEE